MKKLLIILCTAATLFSSSIEEFKTAYATALKAYNANDFQSAYTQFYALSEQAPENVKSIFIWVAQP